MCAMFAFSEAMQKAALTSAAIDLAISADTGHYVALVEEWERYLTDALGPTVHIRDFLRNEAIRIACDECSLLIYSTASDC
jgi:hypothetical protein